MAGRGEYDRLIQFDRVPVTIDESGVEAEGEPELIEKAWAKVRYGTSAERREAAGINASQTATFRVLSTVQLRTVTEQDRITDETGKVWSITGDAPVGGPAREIEFTATTRKG